jgi:flagellar basal-body rod protein FlgC
MSGDAMKIALSGMNDARLRLATAAQNIAASGVTGRAPTESAPETTAYAPQDVVSTAASKNDTALGVQSSVAPRQPAYVLQADATSPDANDEGVVATPNVDVTAETVAAQQAAAAYRANVALIKVVGETEKKLIDAVS